MKSTTALILFGLLVQVSFARKTEVLDQDGVSSSIESIAQAVCDITRGADKQIGQISTIDRLIQYFRSLSPDHRLATCAQQSLPALEQMQLILDTANEDVCASAKVELIERFHRNFISKVRKYRKEQRANHLSAPKLLKLFYMHYASAVSATCERSASKELEAMTLHEAEQGKDTEAAFSHLESVFGKLDSNRGYKGMYLLWNFIDTLPLEKDTKLSRFLHQGNTRLVLQMSSVEKLDALQDVCRNKLKPLYSRSLLSVIRLADLGFYPENQRLAQLLSSSPNYAHLYTVTQMCETILRVKAVENESLNPDQIVVLSKDDTTALDLQDSFVAEPLSSNSKNQLSCITTVGDDESQQFIKKVKANVNSRLKEHSKILKGIVQKFKSEAKTEASHFILSDGAHKEDLKSLLDESLPELDRSDLLASVEDDEEIDEGIVVRKKRGVVNIVKKVFVGIIMVFVCYGYITAMVVLFILRVLVLLPLYFIWHFISQIFGMNENNVISRVLYKGVKRIVEGPNMYK